MGVHGLWQLINSTGKPVPLDALEGKVLAVDVSVWLHQLAKGMRDSAGNPVANAHLHGLFTRICKLLHCRIKPVFVFDGPAPELKRKTLAARRNKREDAEENSAVMQQKILTNLIRTQACKEALGEDTLASLPVVPKGGNSKGNKRDAIFELPPLPETSKVYMSQVSGEGDMGMVEKRELQEFIEEEYADLNAVDVESEDFKSLPAELQHELIEDMKARRKNYNLSKIVELPEDSKDFSNFQMAKLLKYNKLNTRLEDVRKELNQRQTKDLGKYYKNKDYYGTSIDSHRVASDDMAHYILIKGIKKRKEMEREEKKKKEEYKSLVVESEDSSNTDELLQNSENEEIKGLDFAKNSSKGTMEKVSVDTESDKRVKSDNEPTSVKGKGGIRFVEGVVASPEKERFRPVIEIDTSDSSEDEVDEEVDDNSDSDEVKIVKEEYVPESNVMDEFGAYSGDDDLQYAIELSLKDQNSGLSMTDLGNTAEKSKKDTHEHANKTKTFNKRGHSERQSRADKSTPSTNSSSKHKHSSQNDNRKKQTGASGLETIEAKQAQTIVKKDDNTNSNLTLVNLEKEIKAKDSIWKRQKSNKSNEEYEATATNSKFQVDATDKSNGSINDLKRKILTDVEEDTIPTVVGKNDKRRKGQILKRRKSNLSNESEENQTPVVSAKNGKRLNGNKRKLDVFTGNDQNNKGVATKKSKRAALSESEEDEENGELPRRIKIIEEKSGEMANEDVEVVSDEEYTSNSGDDEFLEVKINVDAVQEDELFPASMFDVQEDQEEEEETHEEDNVPSDVEEEEEEVGDSVEEPEEATVEDAKEKGDMMQEEDATYALNEDETVDDVESTIGTEEEEGEMPELEDNEEPTADHVTQQVKTTDASTDLVKAYKSLEESNIRGLKAGYERETRALQQEQGRQARAAASVSDQMYTEAQELLQLFGIPFIVSPSEAEAQCAQLDRAKLTQGTITDDSDVWLFGGSVVYKNFFNQAKYVECFKIVADTLIYGSPSANRVDPDETAPTGAVSSGSTLFANTSNHVTMRSVHIQSQLGLSREKLINLALLCGSDYTEGVQGVGPVTAMEIMVQFQGEGIQGLVKLKDWWEACQKQIRLPTESKLMAKIRFLDLKPGFPSPLVVDAYLNPMVEDSTEKFSWALPDLEQLRQFATSKLGWTRQKTDELLLPVLKRLNFKQTQRAINSFFQPEVYAQPAKMKSKRLQKVVEKFLNPEEATLTDIPNIPLEDTVNKSTRQKGKARGKAKQKDDTQDEVDDEEKPSTRQKGKGRGRAKQVAETLNEEDDHEKSGKAKRKPRGKAKETETQDELREEDKSSKPKAKPRGRGKDKKGDTIKGEGEAKERSEDESEAESSEKGKIEDRLSRSLDVKAKLGQVRGRGRGRGRGRRKNIQSKQEKNIAKLDVDSESSGTSDSESDSGSSDSSVSFSTDSDDNEAAVSKVTKSSLSVAEILGLKIGDEKLEEIGEEDEVVPGTSSDIYASLKHPHVSTTSPGGANMRVFETGINVEELMKLHSGDEEIENVSETSDLDHELLHDDEEKKHESMGIAEKWDSDDSELYKNEGGFLKEEEEEDGMLNDSSKLKTAINKRKEEVIEGNKKDSGKVHDLNKATIDDDNKDLSQNSKSLDQDNQSPKEKFATDIETVDKDKARKRKVVRETDRDKDDLSTTKRSKRNIDTKRKETQELKEISKVVKTETDTEMKDEIDENIVKIKIDEKEETVHDVTDSKEEVDIEKAAKPVAKKEVNSRKKNTKSDTAQFVVDSSDSVIRKIATGVPWAESAKKRKGQSNRGRSGAVGAGRSLKPVEIVERKPRVKQGASKPRIGVVNLSESDSDSSSS